MDEKGGLEVGLFGPHKTIVHIKKGGLQHKNRVDCKLKLLIKFSPNCELVSWNFLVDGGGKRRFS